MNVNNYICKSFLLNAAIPPANRRVAPTNKTIIPAIAPASPAISPSGLNSVKVEMIYTIESAEDDMIYLQRVEDGQTTLTKRLEQQTRRDLAVNHAVARNL